MKEKIKDMLLSPDVEVRRLGLAYLNDFKCSLNFYVELSINSSEDKQPTDSIYIWKLVEYNSFQMFPICRYSFKSLYEMLFSQLGFHNPEASKMINIYVNKCFDE